MNESISKQIANGFKALSDVYKAVKEKVETGVVNNATKLDGYDFNELMEIMSLTARTEIDLFLPYMTNEYVGNRPVWACRFTIDSLVSSSVDVFSLPSTVTSNWDTSGAYKPHIAMDGSVLTDGSNVYPLNFYDYSTSCLTYLDMSEGKIKTITSKGDYTDVKLTVVVKYLKQLT